LNGLSKEPIVGVVKHEGLCYPTEPPYHPSELFPEYPFGQEGLLDAHSNEVYESVRGLLRILGLDAERFGTAQWNPLAEIIASGDTVVIKPNFVFHTNVLYGNEHWRSVITHGAVIRAILDYVFMAVGNSGRIIILDTPMISADFDAIQKLTACMEIQRLYRKHKNVDIQVIDARLEMVDSCQGKASRKRKLRGDPKGNTEVDLGKLSLLHGANGLANLRLDDYSSTKLLKHHHDGHHSYLIPKSILEADVLINVPKLKTHMKAGLTVALKNLIGINASKDYLPHYRLGSPGEGGDEYPYASKMKRIQSLARQIVPSNPLIYRLARRIGKILFRFDGCSGAYTRNPTLYDTTGGAWYGNDTLWRAIIDLNRVFFYADREGVLQKSKQRKYFCLVDGVVAGEGNGPLSPISRETGVLIGGTNPVSIDLVAAALMDFCYESIPFLFQALSLSELPLFPYSVGDISCRSNVKSIIGPISNCQGLLKFQPPDGWKQHIEQ